ncbi:arsenic transporter [Pelotomaculum propionicicum]|uniref:Arsenical pump membrane protein n=1 Tax=Pelotomaculum propionicicum TaxID=258475 RepID=A0A4Y7RUM8_9FIRM|nr:arsenic transporter [Pelotomaculum propionicicum]NLI14058.1 arsenic transporter [Peptococcaceae bacterium]TEB12573.1 Arsenical pump membrane protein [Pelotomaculum propionicicum]
MLTTESTIALTIFLATVLFLLWRPRGLNEYIPTTIGALFIYSLGIVNLTDIINIEGTVMGASITIISTIVMSIVLESVGFFRWTAFNLVGRSKGSGILLYWNVILLCFLMTMFFNNDGSILITTPIIIEIVRILKLKPHQQFPYLCSGALIATAASAPIGVSNLANLIALKIVNLDLVTYAKLMFVPSMMGLFITSILLFIHFRQYIPKRITSFSRTYMFLYDNTSKSKHPLSNGVNELESINWNMFKVYITIIIIVRGCFFVLSHFGFPIEPVAVLGALILIMIRWISQGKGILDVIQKTPWHILIFAYSIYIVVYGLHNTNITSLIIESIKTPVNANLYNAILIMGTLLTIMSNLFNNLPSVMLGTITITQMGLEQLYLQVCYLANIIGSDIGSLILPTGTLATLIWMYILKKNKIPVTWSQYISVTILIIPVGLLTSLISLYSWVLLIS